MGKKLTGKKGDKTIPCINDSLVDKFGLKPDIRQSLPQMNRCIDFSSRPEMLFNFDQANQQLNISIPQARLAWHSENWAPLYMERRCCRCPDGLQLVCQQLPPTGRQQQH